MSARLGSAGGPVAGYLRTRFTPVLVLLSPPRCGSTALARCLWRHPGFRWYAHEPFDLSYHRGGGPDTVLEGLARCLGREDARGRGIVVKEMTFQAGANLPDLLAAATLPVVLAVRDPRLSVRSRMRRREEAGDPAWFPPVESGWTDLTRARAHLRDAGIPYVMVEFDALARRPAEVLPVLCRRLGLEFDQGMLSWPSRPALTLGRLGSAQSGWYRRVLASTGLEPGTAEPPALPEFPEAGGVRAHVAECVRRYREILADPSTITGVSR